MTIKLRHPKRHLPPQTEVRQTGERARTRGGVTQVTGQAPSAGEPGSRAGTGKALQNHRPRSRAATPCTLSPTPHPTPAPGELSPFASGASGFSLELAPAQLAPEDTGGLFLPTWGDVDAREVVPTLRGAGSSVLAGGLRAWGDTICDSLADGLACGPSVLVWDFRAGEGLWARA